MVMVVVIVMVMVMAMMMVSDESSGIVGSMSEVGVVEMFHAPPSDE